MAIFAVFGFAILATLMAVVSRFVKTHGAAKLALRFMAGHHLDGRYRTDAGWLRPGTRVLHPTGHASRWAHLPHLYRAGIRWAVVATIAGICAGLAADRAATVAGLAAFGCVVLVLAAVLAVRRSREWAHVRRYVKPLHRALAPVIGIPLAARPRSWITVPRDFTQADGSRIRLDLPEGFLTTADAKRGIMTAVTDKLALESASVEWRTVGKAPAAIITTTAPPPARVAFVAVRETLASASESAPVIGLGRTGAVVSADYDADSPHVLISAGSGGGKSTLVRGLLAQGLNRGAIGIVCDIKRISHTWTRGLPNVFYSRSIAEIHAMLLTVKAEVDRRNELVDELADNDGNLPAEAITELGPRIILVMEEMNATANRLAAYWRKAKRKDEPAISPAVEALADILFMGRAVSVNVLAVAQMMTARALGGPEARENFATRILARYTVNAWKMLVPEVWPMPRSSRHHGRVQVVIAGTAREVQAVWFTPAEAREWAVAGKVSRFTLAAPAAIPGPATVTVQAPGQAIGAVAATEGMSLVGEPGDARLGLGEACESGVLSAGIAAVRSARARDPEFPPAVGRRGAELLYSSRALTRWESNRPRAMESAGE